MHDVHRDSLLYQGTDKKTRNSGHGHEHEEHGPGDEHTHDHEHDELHDDEHRHDHDHDHDIPHGHQHGHDDAAFEEHEDDLHIHGHDQGTAEDRAFTHVHDHGHNFFHNHHHSHHPEHATVIHRVFGDPLRDWFAALLMTILMGVGYFNLLPGKLSDGMLLCAAVIGIFPLLKNAVFESIARRTFSAEIILGVVLIGGLLLGSFLQVALISLCLLVGSFLRLDFSWKKE